MRDMYIGDFHNPEEEKESWEDYVKRKQKEEESSMSTNAKLILIAIFVSVLYFIYGYLSED